MSPGAATVLSVPTSRFFSDEPASDADLVGGFLIDPNDQFLGVSRLPHAIRIDELRGVTSVVFLGEPGMGKSTAVRGAQNLLATDGVSVEFIDLALLGADEVGGELQRLTDLLQVDPHSPLNPAHPGEARMADLPSAAAPVTEAVIDRPVATDWDSQERVLPRICVVFDGLDEGLRSVDKLAARLARWVASQDPALLLVRFVCRSAEWPTLLDEALKDWAQTRVVHLLPLRRSDVRAAAIEVLGAEADAFVAAVDKRGVGSFASRPITLTMLLSTFKADGSLPESAVELYRQGLLHLADLIQRDPRQPVEDTPEQRLVVATRTAALLRLGDRSFISRGPVATAYTEDLRLDAILGGSEPLDIGRLEVGPSLADRALRTGLFVGGADRSVFAHPTFADFLAARWIIRNKLTSAQVAGMLCGSGALVFPQLRHVAGWLVAHDPAQFGFLAHDDPESFILDVDVPDDVTRAAIVEGLLNRADRGLLRQDAAGSVRSLQHPGIADQLRAHLGSGSEPGRSFALRIAGRLLVPELLDELVEMALDGSVPAHDRVAAALAVGEQGVKTDALAGLICPSASDVPDETLRSDLRGAALLASWPHAVSTRDVLDSLNVLPPDHYWGLEQSFLSSFTPALGADDVPAVVDWFARLLGPTHGYSTLPPVGNSDAHCADGGDSHAESTGVSSGNSLPEATKPPPDPARQGRDALVAALLDGDGNSGRDIERVADACVVLLLTYIRNPGVLPVLALLVAKRIRRFTGLFFERGKEVPGLGVNDRRSLLVALLPIVPLEEVRMLAWGGLARCVVLPQDMFWLAERIPSMPSTLAEKASSLLPMLMGHDETHAIEFAALALDSPVFAVLEPFLSVPVNFEHLELERKNREQVANHERQEREAHERLNLEIAELMLAVASDSGAFFQLQHRLAVSGVDGEMFHSSTDLTLTRSWALLRQEEQELVTLGAVNFLLSASPFLDLSDSVADLRQGDFAAYRAFVLLSKFGLLDEVNSALTTWTPVLVRHPAYSEDDVWETKRLLLGRARESAAETVSEQMRGHLIALSTLDGVVPFDRELDMCWDEALTATAVEVFPRASSRGRDVLARLLARHGSGELAALLDDRIRVARTAEPTDPSVVDLVRLALEFVVADCWDVLEALMAEEPSIVAAAITSVDAHGGISVEELSEERVASLFRWLLVHVPHAEDPEIPRGVYQPTGRGNAARFRDELVAVLARRGTPEALAVLESLSADPDLPWVRRWVNVTRQQVVALSFYGLDPVRLLSLAADPSRRVVRDAGQLRELVVQAFVAIQDRLSGANPEVTLLWDTASSVPKLEDECSNYLCNKLDDLLAKSGVIVNREVQVTQKHRTGIGERVDLLVQANGVTGGLTVPIEVKWTSNPELMTALNAQLVSRYMLPLGTRDGVFCVLNASNDAAAPRLPLALAKGDDPVGTARETLARQAVEALAQGLAVSVVWLDCARPPAAR